MDYQSIRMNYSSISVLTWIVSVSKGELNIIESVSHIKISLKSMCLLFLVFALVFIGPVSTAHAAQIVPPVDPGMLDVVAFDISKGQQTDDVPGFITDLQAAGFTVATVDISTGIPDNVMKIIVLGSADGDELPSSYTAAEGTTLANWVSNGGELMINGEHTIFVPDFEELMKAFGVTPQNNGVSDLTDSDWARLPFPSDYHKSWVYYQSDNFASHPILADVTEVKFLAGCSLDAPSGVIITSDPDASPPNVPVAVALQWGSGRVAMFGDTSWLHSVPQGYDEVDNAKLAMQTISWINEAEPEPEPEPNGIPEFSFAMPVVTSLAAAIYLALRKRMEKKLE